MSERETLPFSQQDKRVLQIAIIGYGATGVGFFYQLATKLATHNKNRDVSVHIFEASKNFCTGLAYSTKHKKMILNMRAGTMGIKAKDMKHFTSTFDLDPNSYPSRSVFW